LRASGALRNFTFNAVAFLRGAVDLSDDGGIMNEDIRAVVMPDEAVALRIVEPLYSPLQFAAPPRWKNERMAPSRDGRWPSVSPAVDHRLSRKGVALFL